MSLTWEDMTDSEGEEQQQQQDTEKEAPEEEAIEEEDEEEYRIDESDGRRYCEREFEECYGGKKEWEDAWAVGKVPWGCSYCGVTDVGCVLQCEDCNKWFCNEKTGTHDVSHAAVHLMLSGSKVMTPHPKAPLHAADLSCHSCSSKNFFLLGYIPHATDPNASVLLCREPCLHACTSDIIGNRAEWVPLIQEKRLQTWIAGNDETSTATYTPTLREVKEFERCLKSDPSTTINDVTRAKREEVELPLHFSDGEHYKEVMSPLVDLEAATDKELCEEQKLNKLEVTWKSADKCAFMMYSGDGSVRISRYDIIMLQNMQRTWKKEMRITNVEDKPNGSKLLEADSTGKPSKPVPGPYILSLEWNEAPFSRVRGAINMFATSETACSEEVYRVLLGHGSSNFSVPSVKPVKPPGLPELNHSQLSAISHALKNPVSLIQGPPGTGKTTTSAAVAYNLVQQHGTLLACTPSNTAADHLAATISRTGLRVVRLLSKVKEMEMSKSEADHLSLNRQLAALVSDAPPDSEVSQLLKRRDKGRGLDGKEARRLDVLQGDLQSELIDKADVVVSTCVSAGDYRLKGHKFEAVLIDEATQATEPELLVAIMKGCTQLVLVGDHCQLGPVVVSDDAKLRGLQQSLFERMIRLGVVPERLLVQYRMHPSLSTWPSGAFYDGALQNGVAEMERMDSHEVPWPRAEHPLLFLHSTSPEELASSGTSYVNRAEAVVIEKSVATLLQVGITPDCIGIITPYEGQRSYINAVFSRSSVQGIQSVEVSSVDAFQGREKEYILLSTVRSNEGQGIGFLTDPRRLNVALTRARRGLVVVGNIKSLGRNVLWHSFLQHLSDLGVISEGWLAEGELRPCTVYIPEPRAPRQTGALPTWTTCDPPLTPPASSIDIISQPELDLISESLSTLSAGPPSLASFSTRSVVSKR